jgi:hypothetical protein
MKTPLINCESTLLSINTLFRVIFIRYTTVKNSTNTKGLKPPPSWQIFDIENWLLEIASLLNDKQPVYATLDLFQQGYDR